MTQIVPAPLIRCWKITEVQPWETNDGVTLTLRPDDQRIHYGEMSFALKGNDWPRYLKGDKVTVEIKAAQE